MAKKATIFILGVVLVAGAAWQGNRFFLKNQAEVVWQDLAAFHEISGPNLQVREVSRNGGFLKGTVEYETYKTIAGVPVAWNRETVEYNVLGNFHRLTTGNEVPDQRQDAEMLQGQFPYNRSYNKQNGQREMLFYHPEVSYKYLNDLKKLGELPMQKPFEIALSFDKPYTLEQVNSMLPNGVRPTWYWVDTYYDISHFRPKQIQVDRKMPDGTVRQVMETVTPQSPELARNVYGFDANGGGNGVAVENFLITLERGARTSGHYRDEYELIFNYLRGSDAKPDAGDIRILGVVVTGSPQELKRLQGAPYLKAAVLGATT